MLRALLYKELRETGWIAAIALLAYLGYAANCAGHMVLPFFNAGNVDGVPFLDGGYPVSFGFVSTCFVIALGMRQSAVESGRGTWLFLLHRPMSMRRIIAVKLAVGAGLYLFCGAVGILTYAVWAAMPGKHPSPFQWWMTASMWNNWGVFTILYLGAFLAGIRPARWFGTRLLPLVAAATLTVFLAVLPSEIPYWRPWGVVALVLVLVCFLSFIDFVAWTRDYS
jgi:hypothetical protein